MTPETFTPPSLRELLRSALHGLTTTGAHSRSPEFFSMAVDHHSDLDARTFAALIGAHGAPSSEEADAEAFLSRTLVPADHAGDATPFARLWEVLREQLRELRVFLVDAGHAPDQRAARYVVGWDVDGRLAGLRLPIGG